MGKSIIRFNLFESQDETLDELNDNLSNINDILGTPHVSKHKYTESTSVYIFVWGLNFDISVDNDIDKFVEFSKVMSEIVDISATKQRMENLDFKIRISDKVTLTVYPKVKSNKSTYSFIFGQDWREIKIDTVELMRFFRDNDVNIVDIEEDYQEIAEMGSLNIEVDSDKVNNEFVELFNDEMDGKLKADKINRSIRASTHGKTINIYPEDEKTYIIKR